MNFSFKFLILAGLLFAGVACTESSPKLDPAESDEDIIAKAQGNINTAVLNPRWDILFVVDDSGSMGPIQENLAINANAFTEAIYQNKLIDFHIGVITSTGLTNGATYYGGPGGSITTSTQNCCGKLVGDVKFVTRDTPNGNVILAQNLLVGTNGGGPEMFFDPIYMALDLKGPFAHYVNQGFYREDAMLAIIIITDTDDQSSFTDAYMLSQFIKSLKGGDERKIFLAAARVSDEDHESGICKGEGDQIPASTRLQDFFDLMGGANVFSVCDVNFGLKLANLGTEISRKAQTMYLDQIPKKGSLSVSMGGQALPQDPVTGWSYDPVAVAIRFGPGVRWEDYPVDTLPEVSYSVLDQTPVEK